ncbi:MAG TPA: DUF624 domain-containing protein [Clostridiaceae bacterium]
MFSTDGMLYKICNYIYHTFMCTILWFAFSLPVILFTVFLVASQPDKSYTGFLIAIPLFATGASTSALFYVMGKYLREGEISVTKEYMKSFKMNFKQGSILSFILFFAYIILVFNISNIAIFKSFAIPIFAVQALILVQLLIMTIYIYPLLARFDTTIKNLIKTSFIMGNKHLGTTILCALDFVGVILLIYKIHPAITILAPGIYAFCSCHFLDKVFNKYAPVVDPEEERE